MILHAFSVTGTAFPIFMCISLSLTSILSQMQESETFLMLSSLCFGNQSWVFENSTKGSWEFVSILVLTALISLWLFAMYMEFDPFFVDFSLKLLMFFMLVSLVISANSAWFLGFFWEILGLVSFKLISHWISSSDAKQGGNSAMNFNSVGDFFLVMFLVISFGCSQNPLGQTGVKFMITILAFCLLKSMCSFTFLWLPEAMEGPTPVSSLLHSATLVMAGIFVLVKFNLQISPILTMFLVTSLLFIFKFSLDDSDLKKIIASSTILMTGLILLMMLLDFSSVGISVTFFHAGYKSILFISAGKLMAGFSGNSDSMISATSGSTVILLLPLFFALAGPGGGYGSAKHNFSISDTGNLLAGVEFLVFSLPILTLCLLTFKMLSNLSFSFKIFAFPIASMGMNLVWFSISFMIFPLGTGISTSIFSWSFVLGAVFCVLNLVKSSSIFNLGSISASSSLEGPMIFSYQWISSVLSVTEKFKFSMNSPDLMGLAVLFIVFV